MSAIGDTTVMLVFHALFVGPFLVAAALCLSVGDTEVGIACLVAACLVVVLFAYSCEDWWLVK